MVARRALSDHHHVMRYVPPSKRFVSSEGDLLGPAPAGFAIRDSDKGGLSVTEVEHFGEMSARCRSIAAFAHRESLDSKKISNNAIFAWSQIADAKSAGQKYNKTLRVVHDPVDGNPGHAEIRHFTDEDLDLLDHFATDVFKEYEIVADMNVPARTVNEDGGN